MTISAHERLRECGVEYGSRKGLLAELETNSIRIQHEQLKAEVARAERKIGQLEAEIAAEEESSKQRIDMKEKKHQQKMEFLKKLNKQLKVKLGHREMADDLEEETSFILFAVGRI
ncbi:axonemal dynein light intermediate polypeptide 1-like [Uloborus diversus]|uniref:axonemal dynein light intermediate polypeptide 1-like n=1 Tax=Uloborus diversus TaxID=327109 RepID=UPI00240915AC|nr:axonemal dynein light intermediate polypeptide 1-like [Uloborus diversus]